MFAWEMLSHINCISSCTACQCVMYMPTLLTLVLQVAIGILLNELARQRRATGTQTQNPADAVNPHPPFFLGGEKSIHCHCVLTKVLVMKGSDATLGGGGGRDREREGGREGEAKEGNRDTNAESV
jgi:hypothetical protein